VERVLVNGHKAVFKTQYLQTATILQEFNRLCQEHDVKRAANNWRQCITSMCIHLALGQCDCKLATVQLLRRNGSDLRRRPSRLFLSQITRRSHDSQECKDPRRQCFCDSWSWPLTPIKSVSMTHCGTLLCHV